PISATTCGTGNDVLVSLGNCIQPNCQLSPTEKGLSAFRQSKSLCNGDWRGLGDAGNGDCGCSQPATINPLSLDSYTVTFTVLAFWVLGNCLRYRRCLISGIGFFSNVIYYSHTRNCQNCAAHHPCNGSPWWRHEV